MMANQNIHIYIYKQIFKNINIMTITSLIQKKKNDTKKKKTYHQQGNIFISYRRTPLQVEGATSSSKNVHNGHKDKPRELRVPPTKKNGSINH